ncbi:MAG: uroporphyrinogen decarboxylase family protein [Anaerolineae bacterium]
MTTPSTGRAEPARPTSRQLRADRSRRPGFHRRSARLRVEHLSRAVAGRQGRGLARWPSRPTTSFAPSTWSRPGVGNEVSVHGEVFSPFTHYMELFGYEPALTSLLEDPGKALALLERLTERLGQRGPWRRREHGVDAVLISSAFAGGPLLSPRMYKRFVLPFERRVAEAVKADGRAGLHPHLRQHRRPAGVDAGDRHRGHRHPGPAAAGQRGTAKTPRRRSASAPLSRAT